MLAITPLTVPFVATFFDYFTVERLFVFLLQLEMIEPVSYTHLSAVEITIGSFTLHLDAHATMKDYLNAFIVALASKWSVNEPIVISTADAEGLTKYFAAKAKDLLDKGVKIEQVNGIKTLFSVSPADGSYKVNFGEEEFMNYFKEFLRPQLVEMLF